MRIIGEEMGMVFLPSLELTVPTRSPNGPHICCYLTSETAAAELVELVLKGKRNFAMPAFNNAGDFPDVISELYSKMVAGSKSLFMVPAHPFNQHSPERPIYDVGLLSMVEGGPYSLAEVLDLIPYFQGIEAWNMDALQDGAVPHLMNRELSDYVQEICSVHLPAVAQITSNSIAWAFARQLSSEGKILHTLSGTDDHFTPDMDYRSEGILQMRGHTSIDMARVYAGMDGGRKPTSEELIGWLLADEAVMKARVYHEVRGGSLQVSRERTLCDQHTFELVRSMSEEGSRKWGKAVAKDIFMMRFGPSELRNLIYTFTHIRNKRIMPILSLLKSLHVLPD
jgi:hypothetical protein